LDESKKADKSTLDLFWVFSRPGWEPEGPRPIPNCFHNQMRAKELKRYLSSSYPKSFQAWMRIRRLISQHSTYPELFSWLVWEPEGARPIPNCFNNRMRAK
jgi:hypothetical protein